MKKLNDLFLKLRHYFFPHSLATKSADCTRCKPGSNPATDNSSGSIKFEDSVKRGTNNSSIHSVDISLLSNPVSFELTNS